MKMNLTRRKLFSLGAATAGASLVPSWLSKWFEPQDPFGVQDPAAHAKAVDLARVKHLKQSIERAKKEGKPLLVFVVPTDEGQQWHRGSWFGAFLNHGGKLAMLEMALCVPACAQLSQIKKVTGVTVKGDPAMLLLDPGETPKVTPVEFTLGKLGGDYDPEMKWEDRNKNDKRLIEASLKKLTEQLLKTMHQHGSNLVSLSKSAKATMTPDERAQLATWFDGGKCPDDALVVRAAAEVRRYAAEEPARYRQLMIDQLVKAFERSVVKKPIAGARWASSMGCGLDLENETEEEKKNRIGIACGMGHTPPMTQRFLSFYHKP